MSPIDWARKAGSVIARPARAASSSRQPLVERQPLLPFARFERPQLAAQPALVVRVELAHPRDGRPRQNPVGLEQGPGGQLGPDVAVVVGMVAGEVHEHAQDAEELVPSRAFTAPVQALAVGGHAPANGVEPLRSERRGSDGLDRGFVEEAPAGDDERGQGPVVVGVRLVEEEDAVGIAADGLLGVPGQRFQPARRRGRRPQLRLGQQAFDLGQGDAGFGRLAEERRRGQLMRRPRPSSRTRTGAETSSAP